MNPSLFCLALVGGFLVGVGMVFVLSRGKGNVQGTRGWAGPRDRVMSWPGNIDRAPERGLCSSVAPGAARSGQCPALGFPLVAPWPGNRRVFGFRKYAVFQRLLK